MWRNEVDETTVASGGGVDSGPVEVPTRVVKIVISKREEFKGVREEANADHYKVEGGDLWIRFEDFFLESLADDTDEMWNAREGDHGPYGSLAGLCVTQATLAQEAADLWFGDGELVNDWYEGKLSQA